MVVWYDPAVVRYNTYIHLLLYSIDATTHTPFVDISLRLAKLKTDPLPISWPPEVNRSLQRQVTQQL